MSTNYNNQVNDKKKEMKMYCLTKRGWWREFPTLREVDFMEF